MSNFIKKIGLFLIFYLSFSVCFAKEIDVFKLAENGTPEQLEAALRAGAKFNVEHNISNFDTEVDNQYWPFDTGETPLHRAAFCNHNLESIKFFIDQGLDVNAVALVGNYASISPLACALYGKNIIAVKELLKAGANPNSWIEGGLCFVGTPFHIVAFDYSDDNVPIARESIFELIKAGGNINSHEELSEEDLNSLRDSEPEFAKNSTIFLPRKQWNGDEPFFNMTGSFSHYAMGNFLATFTPLMWAVILDKPEMVAVFLDFRADVNIKSVENKSAIDYADDLPNNSKIKKSSVFERLKGDTAMINYDISRSCMVRNVVIICDFCHGSGICRLCKGQGGWYMYIRGCFGPVFCYVKCEHCDGKGACNSCDGKRVLFKEKEIQ